jgi:hypothetical protein
LLLEKYRIGNLCESDVKSNKESANSASDPYANEPSRDRKLAVLSLKPFNAETPFE